MAKAAKKNSTAALEAKLTAEQPSNQMVDAGLLSSGLVLLNLACSGSPMHAFKPGHSYLLIGRSRAGKSFEGRQILAEACRNPYYANYDLWDDDPEHGALMGYERFWGSEMARRVKPPTPKGCSTTHEAAYDNILAKLKSGRPCIYLLDSEDALYPEAEAKKNKANAKVRSGEAEGKTKGTMGMSKAKTNSSRLPEVNDWLARTGSILIMIKQSRQNVGPGAMFEPETRNGGVSLTFFATLEIWFSIVGKIRMKTKVGDPEKQRVIGSMLGMHVKKNRVSGTERRVVIPFYPGSSHGFDDLGSQVDWLIEENHWEGSEKMVTAPEFDVKNKSKDYLIQKIEAENQERKLRRIVADLWERIEKACAIKRKRRYQ
jgi:hypothetical protein